MVRLTGLLYNSTFASLTDSAVSSAKFYISDGSGTSASTVILYPLSSSSWTESGVTWNNVGGYSTSYSASASVGGGNFASFDITNLVKAWRRDEYGGGENGFILIGASESSVDRALYSSEHSTTTKRPYVVLDYTAPVSGDFYSDYSSADVYRNTFNETQQYLDENGGVVDINVYYDDGLQLRANCYGYAFRFSYSPVSFPSANTVTTTKGSTFGFYTQVPGEFASKSSGITIGSYTIRNYDDLNYYYQTCIFNSSVNDVAAMNNLVQLLYADANTLDYTLTEYTGDTIPDGDYYTDRRLIAVVLADYDYHFYMQHSDNTWSHKPGHLAPSNIAFESKETITNDNIESYGQENGYNRGIRYFYITKNAVTDYRHGDGTATTCQQTVITAYCVLQ